MVQLEAMKTQLALMLDVADGQQDFLLGAVLAQALDRVHARLDELSGR